MTSSRVDLRGAFSIATVAFSHPFTLPEGQKCPPGIYEIETEEEPRDGSPVSWRRPATTIRLGGHAQGGRGILPVNLVWLREALAADRKKGLPENDVGELHDVS